MAEHKATVMWERNGAVFTDNRYSRAHRWLFDEGVEVLASSSPHVVRPPMSRTDAVDPEEAFIAALSSCHMLFFLSFAAKRGFVIDRYHDDAVGVMAQGTDGKVAIIEVTLRPNVTYSGDKRPTLHDEDEMHHQAHEQCFIANSVKTQVRCEPVR